MSKRCLNCNNEVTDNFCSKCGQPIQTSRISWKHLIDELQYGLLHINKGLLYTEKEMLFSPGVTIKNYLEGKRVKYTKPFLFLIIWGAIYSLVYHTFHFFPMKEMNNPDNTFLEYIPLYEWYANHYSLFILFTLPIFALSTYWILHKSNYNYIEHLVVFSYINGGKIFILLLCYPLIYFSKSIPIYHIVHIIATIYVIWGISTFFKTKSWSKAILKVVLCFILTYTFMVIIFTITLGVFEYYNIKL
ncbi:MAG: DUF3667 domain-containing protein [Dysgonomonas sp.]|nr:DUF3667 domain-containing protein [Dysgonomonas sp.]